MDMNNTRVLCGIAAGAVLLGSITPWATVSFGFFSVSVSGTDGGDGWFTVAAAVVAIVGLCLTNRWMFGVSMFVAAAIAAFEVINISDIADEAAVAVSIGWGLLLLGAGAVLGSVMTFVWPSSAVATSLPGPGFQALPPRPYVQGAPPPGTAPGWQWDGYVYRWWDGQGWTFHTAATTDRPR